MVRYDRYDTFYLRIVSGILNSNEKLLTSWKYNKNVEFKKKKPIEFDQMSKVEKIVANESRILDCLAKAK